MASGHEEDDLSRAILSMTTPSEFSDLARRISEENPEICMLLFGNLFEKRGKLYAEAGDTESAQTDAWTVCLLHAATMLSYGYDGFHVVEERSVAGQQAMAEWSELPPEAYQVFWERGNDTDYPIQVRAIMLLALWELKTFWHALDFARPIDVVDMAIDRYIEAAKLISLLKIDPPTKGMCVSQQWKTAIRLGLSVGRLDLIKNNLENLRTLSATIMEEAPHWSLDLVEAELSVAEVKGQRRTDLVSDERLEDILAVLDKTDALLAAMGSMICRQRDLVAVRGNVERLLGRGGDAKTSAERLALLHEQNAEAAGSGILAHMQWKEAAGQYQQAGSKEKANHALAEAREALRRAQDQGEFKEVSTSVPLSDEKLNQIIEPYFQDASSTGEILERVARQLFAPSLSTQSAARRMPQSIISQIAMTLPVVDDRSHASIEPGSPEQEVFTEHQAICYEVSFYSSILLCSIFSRLRKLHKPTPDDFVSHVSASSVVPSEEIEFYRLGFQHYLAGDNISSMHILIPRIEQLVRWILRRADVKATALRAEEIRERPLGELLREGEATETLSEPVVSLLQAVLSEEWGWNLRNRIAHGFATLDDFTQEKMERTVHIVLMIARIPR